MGEGLDTDTQAQSVDHGNGAIPSQPVHTSGVWRTLVLLGLAAASAGLAFAIVRRTLRRPPSDPTTERIQTLIDEANRLLKQIDDEKGG
jgi:hypothetical protein